MICVTTFSAVTARANAGSYLASTAQCRERVIAGVPPPGVLYMRIRIGAVAGAVLSLTLAAASSLAAQAATAAMPICKDGTTSSVAGRGACSGHGGVDATATAAAKKTDKAAKSASSAAKAADKAADKATKATDKSAAKADAAVAKSDAKVAEKSAGAAKAQAKAADKTADASKTAAKATDKAADNAAKSAKAADKSADKAASTAAKTKTASTTKAGNTDPTDATAQCKDGTYSHAKTHQGACSNHGGVAKFLK